MLPQVYKVELGILESLSVWCITSDMTVCKETLLELCADRNKVLY
ncbi:hypothetical protein ANAPC3_01308 [Anaplasma phagocytophilum]|nr:hypothetical protein ANAPC2_00772 [Anaplasma phagocytophilum]SBO33654.1 hypothetical protein ANAPC3_01308 [Anaplasma phagocytophilum]SBO33842.1 hypothetical protein ANAPC4_01315 [Anaplasma phagocytophilum]